MKPTEQVVAAAVRQFLAGCRMPALNEPGEEMFPLPQGGYVIEERQGRLYLQAWDSRRTLTRRLLEAASAGRGRLECRVERFGGRPGTLTLLDLAALSNHAAPSRSIRQTFREQFRRMLTRQFPGMRIVRLSSEPDLEHSLSPSYPRALLGRGTDYIAAIAAPLGTAPVEGVLTFGLIWLDYLRRRMLPVRALAVFVPEDRETSTCLRVKHLDKRAAGWSVFAYSNSGETRLDLDDFGNINTRMHRERSGGEFRLLHTPEGELEASLHGGLEALDARLLPSPVYRQAPTSAAGQRGIIDLLAVDRTGRLSVIELKASEDIHLPLQALDYWIRVKWHLDRGELTACGYFPGIELRRAPPRMILAAPALQFHPTNETILRFLDPTIETERIGLGPNLRVMFRV